MTAMVDSVRIRANMLTDTPMTWWLGRFRKEWNWTIFVRRRLA